MKPARAVLGSLLFLLAAPGTMAGLVPYWITGWRTGPAFLGLQALRVVGALLAAAGLASLLDSFLRFAVEGLGTPAPIAAPVRLVVTGQYRHVRNPMYVAVLALVAGQALLLGSRALLLYGFLFWLATHAFVTLYEEPTLAARFGPAYAEYRQAVGRWRPRLRPWRRPEDAAGAAAARGAR